MQVSPAPPRHRRRPSGEPPPLPRAAGWARSVVVLAVVVGLGIVVSLLLRSGVADPWAEDLLRSIRDAAPAWLTDLASRIDVVGSVWVVLVLRVATLATAAAFARWRHFVVFLVTVALTDWIVVSVLGVARPVPGAFPS
jgi:hypothetical protein